MGARGSVELVCIGTAFRPTDGTGIWNFRACNCRESAAFWPPDHDQK